MQGMQGVRVMHVLKEGVERDHGARTQASIITAAKTVSEIVRTTLGPRGMLKMIIDPAGGVVLTNDGNAILRDLNVKHPAAKHMIELARTQEEEVGDGTTSVIILAGELLGTILPLLESKIHPITLSHGLAAALDSAVQFLSTQARKVDGDGVTAAVRACLGTKALAGQERLVADLAIQAVRRVKRVDASGRVEIDTKRYAKIEKIPGADVSDSRVLSGVMINKDLCHPKMRRVISNPRIILLDCPLEYKKLESMVSVEITETHQFEDLLKVEEAFVKAQVDSLLALKPDVVISEKGISTLAVHFLQAGGVSTIRRVRKTDNNRIARVCGATIVSRCEEVKERDIGKTCGTFKVDKIGDEYFTYFDDCTAASACSIVLRGASKDVLNDVERAFGDAVGVARLLELSPSIVAGGGASEMAVARHLTQAAATAAPTAQPAFRALAAALEVIPRTLAQNCGGSVMRVLTALRAAHAAHTGAGACTTGVDGETGELVDTMAAGIVEPMLVKAQTLKTAVEAACVLLRIDEIVSGIKGAASERKPMGGGPKADEDAPEA